MAEIIECQHGAYVKGTCPECRREVRPTGGRVNYYLAQVAHPQRADEGAKPYQAECEDIIEALGMNFDEGCIFKALWRSAAARQANGKPGHSALYDAEKMVHYANRLVRRLRRESEDGNST